MFGFSRWVRIKPQTLSLKPPKHAHTHTTDHIKNHVFRGLWLVQLLCLNRSPRSSGLCLRLLIPRPYEFRSYHQGGHNICQLFVDCFVSCCDCYDACFIGFVYFVRFSGCGILKRPSGLVPPTWDLSQPWDPPPGSLWGDQREAATPNLDLRWAPIIILSDVQWR